MIPQTAIEFNRDLLLEIQKSQRECYRLVLAIVTKRDSCACDEHGPCHMHALAFKHLQTAEQALTEAALSLTWKGLTYVKTDSQI